MTKQKCSECITGEEEKLYKYNITSSRTSFFRSSTLEPSHLNKILINNCLISFEWKGGGECLGKSPKHEIEDW